MLHQLNTLSFLDIHYHANPDLYERRHSALMAGKLYSSIGGGVVLRSHAGSTTEIAYIAREEGLPVYGSISLNSIGGGIDYRRVLSALSHRKNDSTYLLVDFPTITGRTHSSKLPRKLSSSVHALDLLSPETISKNNKIKPSVIDVLKLSLDYPIVVSSGHASKKEAILLIESAEKIGVRKLLLNQPANPLTGFNYEELSELTSFEFLWIEQTALTLILGYQTLEDFSKVMLFLPRVIYSSDLGQETQMDIAEWRKQSLSWFDSLNLTKERRDELCKFNPIALLS